jgi:hypothetical protein
MFWICVLATIVLIGIISDTVGEAIVYSIIAIICAWFVFPLWGYECQVSDKYYVDQYYIYSLSLREHAEGTFVLGCGSVDSNSYYTFYTKDSNENYKLSRVPTAEALIHMDSSQQPKVMQKAYKRTRIPCTIFGGTQEEAIVNTEEYLLVVPDDTIKQEFKVN